MKDIRWRGTSWLDDELALPPRYGIVTSNTSESVNSMLSDARDVGWLQAVEKIVDIISTKIYRCRQKYKDCHAHGIVPIVAQVMKKRWDIAASLEVIELEEGLGQFKVVNTNYVASNDDDDVAHNSDDNALPLVSC
jgi:RNA:NAD 2'-phosphotransferase (TPT1/KptA family)